MKIGQTLKLLRIAAKLKQAGLANSLGVTTNYLSLVENDRREPSLSLLKKFAEVLDVPLGYLLWIALDEHSSDEAITLREKMDELLSVLARQRRYASTEKATR
jgi:transcriptional regulator with XRE-family HTH domain